MKWASVFLFNLILYVQSTIFQLNRDGSFWVEPVLSFDKCVLLKNHNTVTPVRLEPAATRSRVKHSTTEPLRYLKLGQCMSFPTKCDMCDQQSLRPACAYAQSDQSLCKSLEYYMIVKLLTELHLEFLSLKGGCRCSSESTHVIIPHYWKAHALAQMISHQ